MNKIVIKGNDIDNYIEIMSRFLTEFIDTIKIMDNYKKDLVWESPSQTLLIEKYDNMIKDHLSFTDRIMKFLEFLNKYTGNYSDVLIEIKKEYDIINKEYGV